MPELIVDDFFPRSPYPEYNPTDKDFVVGCDGTLTSLNDAQEIPRRIDADAIFVRFERFGLVTIYAWEPSAPAILRMMAELFRVSTIRLYAGKQPNNPNAHGFSFSLSAGGVRHKTFEGWYPLCTYMEAALVKVQPNTPPARRITLGALSPVVGDIVF